VRGGAKGYATAAMRHARLCIAVRTAHEKQKGIFNA